MPQTKQLLFRTKQKYIEKTKYHNIFLLLLFHLFVMNIESHHLQSIGKIEKKEEI